MRRDYNRNLWVCTAYEPYFEISVEDAARPMEAILGSSQIQLLRAPTGIPMFPPPALQDVDAMLAAWGEPAFVATTTTAATATTSELTNYTQIQYDVAEEKYVTEQERTKEWFNGMPKPIKLMLIALNPEEKETIEHHYSRWDNRQIIYTEFSSETRKQFHEARKRMVCPAPE
jgi:hypothetical protein